MGAAVVQGWLVILLVVVGVEAEVVVGVEMLGLARCFRSYNSSNLNLCGDVVRTLS